MRRTGLMVHSCWKNASSFKTERDLGKYSIFGNILFAHALFVHFVCNLHIGPLYAVLAFKNFLLAMTCNAFDKQHHGLDIPNGNYHVVASNLRQQMAQAATRITTRTIATLPFSIIWVDVSMQLQCLDSSQEPSTF